MNDTYKTDRNVISVLAKNFDMFDCKGQVARISNLQFRVKIKPNAVIP